MTVLLLLVTLLTLSVGINKLLWRREITIREMGINLLAVLIPFLVVWFLSIQSKLADFEILNGKVVNKKIERVSCEHSYPCHCREQCSGSGKDRSCYTYCDTCYDHPYDNDYVIKSTIGDFFIDRIDSQGLKTPKRYTEVQQEDSVSRQHTYKNYIRASENTLFKDSIKLSKEELKLMPKYPGDIFDYYKINRILDLTQSYSKEELDKANQYLSKSLNDLGNTKQVNLILVITTNSEEFALKLASAWNRGKKNDVITVIGLEETESKKISFVRVFSWSRDSIFDVKLRDSLLELNSVDLTKAIDISTREIAYSYNRRAFEEFSYLKWQVIPSDTFLLILTLISLAISTSVGYYLSRNEEREYDKIFYNNIFK